MEEATVFEMGERFAIKQPDGRHALYQGGPKEDGKTKAKFVHYGTEHDADRWMRGSRPTEQSPP